MERRGSSDSPLRPSTVPVQVLSLRRRIDFPQVFASMVISSVEPLHLFLICCLFTQRMIRRWRLQNVVWRFNWRAYVIPLFPISSPLWTAASPWWFRSRVLSSIPSFLLSTVGYGLVSRSRSVFNSVKTNSFPSFVFFFIGHASTPQTHPSNHSSIS